MKLKNIISILMIGALSIGLVACSSNGTGSTAPSDSAALSSSSVSSSPSSSTVVTNGDAAAITLNGSSITTDGPGVTVDGTDVTITAGGDYTVSGTLSGGSIVIDASGETVNLILNGVDITSSVGPAILVKAGDDVTITLASGTENTLTDGSASEDYDATLYGVVSFAIDGTGTLNVNGTVEEGIASDGNITVNNGTINIKSTDDGMNGSEDNVSEIIIKGGTITIDAGGDGLDSNGDLTITGGEIITMGSVNDANTGIDADGTFTLTGGTVFSTGSNANLIEPANSDAQNYILVTFNSLQAANSTVTIKDGDTVIYTATVTQSYQSVFFSSGDITTGTTYTIFVDDVAAGTANAQ